MKKLIKFRILIQMLFLGFMIFSIAILDHSISKIFVLGAIFLVGSYYCGWVCPFGTLQEYIDKLRKRIIKKTYNVPEKVDKILSSIRYIFLISAVLFIVNPLDARGAVFSALKGEQIMFFSLIILAAFLVLSLFIERPYCRWFCTAGAKFGILGMGRVLTIKRDNGTCVNCGKCDKACPVNIKISKCENIVSPKCINCLSCITECPKKSALKIGLRSISGKYNILSYFIGLTFGIWVLTELFWR
ncbi:4Fe-4S binding protein [Sebaldella sp. S0638]|uniref:4Fe-4S binding protein n=1 Tax=Sebaldella sp. S0638 TaxID=2957809 RepID=UPI00209E44AA|nr:4Fe-4S binding protein [Sebaldella sp. S0638]MCP1224516.1 4Fe-4S binding protein [Sebaldella sp. S0638]